MNQRNRVVSYRWKYHPTQYKQSYDETHPPSNKLTPSRELMIWFGQSILPWIVNQAWLTELLQSTRLLILIKHSKGFTFSHQPTEAKNQVKYQTIHWINHEKKKKKTQPYEESLHVSQVQFRWDLPIQNHISTAKSRESSITPFSKPNISSLSKIYRLDLVPPPLCLSLSFLFQRTKIKKKKLNL